MMILAGIEIIISWGAVAVLVSFIGIYIATLGGMFWKFFGHVNDSDVHINKHVHIVSQETCDATKKSIKETLNDVKKAIEKTNDIMLRILTDREIK